MRSAAHGRNNAIDKETNHRKQQVAELWRSRSWPADPQDFLQEQGYAIREKSLSVGWARILARIDMVAQVVYIDSAAIVAYAEERGITSATVRREALAHEAGHLLMSSRYGDTSEEAAQMVAKFWSATSPYPY